MGQREEFMAGERPEAIDLDSMLKRGRSEDRQQLTGGRTQYISCLSSRPLLS